MNTRIDYRYVHLNFDWNWIKDKQIMIRGNKRVGMLVIVDVDGNTVGMYGYEEIITLLIAYILTIGLLLLWSTYVSL